MIDVVVNNIAMKGDGSKAVYRDFSPPFNDKKYFHPFKQVKNYGDQLEAQNGWLGDEKVALPDLDTESDYVQKVWHDWTREMIANYSRTYPLKPRSTLIQLLTLPISGWSAYRCCQTRQQALLGALPSGSGCLHLRRSLHSTIRVAQPHLRLVCQCAVLGPQFPNLVPNLASTR